MPAAVALLRSWKTLRAIDTANNHVHEVYSQRSFQRHWMRQKVDPTDHWQENQPYVFATMTILIIIVCKE